MPEASFFLTESKVAAQFLCMRTIAKNKHDAWARRRVSVYVRTDVRAVSGSSRLRDSRRGSRRHRTRRRTRRRGRDSSRTAS